MTLDQISELIEECRRLDSALVIDPDVVAALVRVALAAKAYAAITHGNLRAARYRAARYRVRQEARDALADALEELE